MSTGTPLERPAAHREKRLRPREIWALALLQLGMLVCGVGWAVGVALLWSSTRWTRGQKLLATLLMPGGLAGFLLIGWRNRYLATTETTCVSEPGGIENCTVTPVAPLPPWFWPALVLWAVACLAVTAYLVLGAHVRTLDARQDADGRAIGWREAGALLLLQFGSLVVIGWPIGAFLLWTSDRWKTSEKLAGTLIVPGGTGLMVGLVLPLTAFTFTTSCLNSVCTGPTGLASWVPVLAALATLASLATGIYLALAARPGRAGAPTLDA